MCELDLIFGFETLHAVLGEMVVGGVVVETGLERIVEGVRLSEGGMKGKRRAVNEGGFGGVGGGSGGGSGGRGGLGRSVGAGAGGAMRVLGWAGGGGLSGWR